MERDVFYIKIYEMNGNLSNMNIVLITEKKTLEWWWIAIQKMIMIFFLTLMLAGCSMGNKTSTVEDFQEVATDPVVEVTNEPVEGDNNSNITEPTYIDESKYEGDQLGIVQTLNLIIKASYERNYDVYNSLITENLGPTTSFKKYFISIDKLDFSVIPTEFTPPKDIKPVVLDYTEHIYGDKGNDKEKQMFLFQLEDDKWKLDAITDRW
ncbi:hypothetical protein D3P07_12140 [Paenibacillus sp. 1011MAR3C5]|uniref:lipoprotein n=1 Tax=Paenibacillus sp. 1011MAR3C5 TaxID=1675787 RepID=UPI000E6B8849|nr:lipoprotein [Paenibacillus sp. 1011MAR3C5]RJE88731.1 hypothetical protein D3P07_12140 [Paenibacillus sp. 1011MAR3C5]